MVFLRAYGNYAGRGDTALAEQMMMLNGVLSIESITDIWYVVRK